MIPFRAALLSSAYSAGGGGGGTPLATPKWSNFVYLAGFNGTDGVAVFTDEGMFSRSPLRTHGTGISELDTAWSKFGGSSLLLAVNDYLTGTADLLLDLGSEQFTLGCWVRFSSVGSSVALLGKCSASTGWLLDLASGTLRFRLFDTTAVVSTSFSWSPSTGTDYFLMVDRDASLVTRLYIDGTMVSKDTATAAAAAATQNFSVGRLPYSGTGTLDGWMDEAFIIKGEALCGSDAGFAVPTAAFTRGSRYESTTSTSISTSSYATKGTLVDVVNTKTLKGVGTYLAPTGSETYKIVVAEVNPSGNTISAILGTSDEKSVSASAYGLYNFNFSSDMTLTSGKRIAFLVVRTDGTSTSTCRVPFPGSGSASNSDFTYYGCARYASNNPTVGDAILYDNSSVVRIIAGYTA